MNMSPESPQMGLDTLDSPELIFSEEELSELLVGPQKMLAAIENMLENPQGLSSDQHTLLSQYFDQCTRELEEIRHCSSSSCVTNCLQRLEALRELFDEREPVLDDAESPSSKSPLSEIIRDCRKKMDAVLSSEKTGMYDMQELRILWKQAYNEIAPYLPEVSVKNPSKKYRAITTRPGQWKHATQSEIQWIHDFAEMRQRVIRLWIKSTGRHPRGSQRKNADERKTDTTKKKRPSQKETKRTRKK